MGKWTDRLATVVTTIIVFVTIAYLASCPTSVKAERTMRFTRVGFDALDDITSVSVIRDAESGQCRAFVMAQFGVEWRSSSRGVALSDTWPVACDGMGESSFRTGGGPRPPGVPASAIR